MRITKSSKILLHLFEKENKAISVVTLVEQLKMEMNKTTVYRILYKLEENGILHSFLDKEGLKWFAKCNECSIDHHNDTHPHFQCQDCGEIKCISAEVKVPSIKTHQIDFARVLLVGKCDNCN